MTLASEAAGNLHVDRELAFDFLVIFSRFEYALKEMKHVHKNGKLPRNLDVDYSGYAQNIEGVFAARIKSSDSLKAAVEYFCQSPPRRQIWDGFRPDWAAPETGLKPSASQMLVFTFRVRNNLFHGGKGWLAPEGNIDRDRRLMESAIAIIQAVLEIDEELLSAFSSYQ
jgi:hypothetical protein